MLKKLSVFDSNFVLLCRSSLQNDENPLFCILTNPFPSVFSSFFLCPPFVFYYSRTAGVHIVEQSGVKCRRVQVLHLHRYKRHTLLFLYVVCDCWQVRDAAGGLTSLLVKSVCCLYDSEHNTVHAVHMVSDSLTQWWLDPHTRSSRPSSSLSSLNGISTLSHNREPDAGASCTVGWQHTLAGPGPPPAGCLFSPANPLSVELTAKGVETHWEEHRGFGGLACAEKDRMKGGGLGKIVVNGTKLAGIESFYCERARTTELRRMEKALRQKSVGGGR